MSLDRPDWDAMDFSAARRLAASGARVGSSLIAQDRTGAGALALVRDERTGWLVIVLTDLLTGQSFIPTVVDAAETETRLQGSVAATDGPTLHYVVARAESVESLRMRVPDRVWAVHEANAEGWAVGCLSIDDSSTCPRVEILAGGVWMTFD
ncbi:hypothetical protein [Cellulomonas xylanilytica]|uniref:hypothetical protein n=1 Tax=Cellulomonas xylanilytica TaxID=233583 RepID=UPI0011BEC0FA|nr:hypothetical protein [Cellulomonas xylanilytica]